HSAGYFGQCRRCDGLLLRMGPRDAELYLVPGRNKRTAATGPRGRIRSHARAIQTQFRGYAHCRPYRRDFARHSGETETRHLSMTTGLIDSSAKRGLRLSVPVLVGALSLALTLTSWWILSKREEELLSTRFQLQSEERFRAIEARLTETLG